MVLIKNGVCITRSQECAERIILIIVGIIDGWRTIQLLGSHGLQQDQQILVCLTTVWCVGGEHDVCPFDSYIIRGGGDARSAPVPLLRLSGPDHPHGGHLR